MIYILGETEAWHGGTSLRGTVPIPWVSRLRRESCCSLSRQETVLAAGMSLGTALPMKYLCCCSFPGHSISSTRWTPVTISKHDCLRNIPVAPGQFASQVHRRLVPRPKDKHCTDQTLPSPNSLALSTGKHNLVLAKRSSKHVWGFYGAW